MMFKVDVLNCNCMGRYKGGDWMPMILLHDNEFFDPQQKPIVPPDEYKRMTASEIKDYMAANNIESVNMIPSNIDAALKE